MDGLTERLARIIGDRSLVVIAGRMTEAGCPTTAAAIRMWVSGERVPGSDRITYLARALNVTPNDLLGFTNSEVAVDGARVAGEGGGECYAVAAGVDVGAGKLGS